MSLPRLNIWGTIAAGLLLGTVAITVVDAMHPDQNLEPDEETSSFSMDKCLGLVLAGGGAKGAYEVGVWKAMEELGLTERVYAFSGTSIGAINSALFASVGSASRCVDIWMNNVSEAFEVDPAMGFDVVQGALDVFLSNCDESVRSQGICKTDGLRRLIRRNLPVNWTKEAPFVYATATTREERRIARFCLNGLNVSTYGEYLMASSAIPYLFPAVKIGALHYVDGGVSLGDNPDSIDNVPLKPLLDAHPELKTIIVVYLDGDSELAVRQSVVTQTSARLIEIIPSIRMNDGFLGLRKTLDFSQENTSRLIQTGYDDAMRVFQVELSD